MTPTHAAARLGTGRSARLITGAAIGLAAGIGTGAALKLALINGGFGDFRGSLWIPGHLIRLGLSPYPGTGPLPPAPNVYPPPLTLLAGVPSSLLAFKVAAVIWSLVLVLCSAAALYVLGVRDPRCYVAALMTFPVAGAIAYGNATPVVILLAALAYRYRGDPLRSGLALGAALAIKPFMLPMLFWGRARRGVIAVCAAAVLIVLGWAAIGFRGLGGYPHLLSRLTDELGPHGASAYAFALQLGATPHVATAIALAAAAAVVVVGRASFNSVVLASLLYSPITWSAYFALLFVLIAAQSPRFSARWLVGVWYTPHALHSPGERPLWAIALSIAAAVYICAVPPGRGTAFARRLLGPRVTRQLGTT